MSKFFAFVRISASTPAPAVKFHSAAWIGGEK